MNSKPKEGEIFPRHFPLRERLRRKKNPWEEKNLYMLEKKALHEQRTDLCIGVRNSTAR